jgi:hypothetical protein
MTFRMLLLVIITLPIFSCSEFLKGKPKKDDTIEVSKTSINCVKDTADKLKNFMDSNISDKELDEAFSCIDSTMNEFQSRVEGKVDPNSFNQEELQKIFDKFMPGTKISGDATKNLLLAKTALLGGTADKISKQEISDLRKFMDAIRTEAKALAPYARLFKFKKEATPFSKKMLEDGFGQLNLSLKNLFKASRLGRSDYQFADVQKLIESLKLVDESHDDLMSLALKVKNLLGGTQPLKTESDYTVLIDNLTQVLHLYSFHLQGYVAFTMENPAVLNDTVEYVEKWIALLENSLQFKKTKVVATETLDPLITEVSDKGLFPILVKTDTLLHFYKLLIMRAFDVGPTADVNSFTGLSKGHFVRIKNEIAIYKLYLQFVNSLNIQDRLSVNEIQERLKRFDTKAVPWMQKFDEANRGLVNSAFEELKSELLSNRPVLYHAKKMAVAANQNSWDQSWEDLVRALYAKMLARELIIGWGDGGVSKLVAHASLSEAQLVQWYSDFRQFGIEVKTFDPRSVNSGAVSFKQANLLTYSADGDDHMNFLETTQYLNMLISGGGQTSHEMLIGFEQAKCQLPDKDVFGNSWNDEKCVIQDLRANFNKYFSNMSFLVEYASSLDEEQFADFYNHLMEVTRVNSQYAGQKVETADLRNMAILLHYIETLYAVFDTDMNRKFSPAELRVAFAARFKNFATKFAHDHSQAQLDRFNSFLGQRVGGYFCYTEDDLIRESFIFMVYYGHPPKAPGALDDSWIGDMASKFSKQSPKELKLTKSPCSYFSKPRPLIEFQDEVDRGQVINTFKILKTVLGS